MRTLASLSALSIAVLACSKAAPPAPSASPGSPETHAPATADAAAASPEDAAPAPDAASPGTPDAAPAPSPSEVPEQAPWALHAPGLRKACEAGDGAACRAIAAHDIGLTEALAQTVIDPDTDLPRVDPVASGERACGHGDWKSCLYVARVAGGPCGDTAGNAEDLARAKDLHRKARPLMEADCPADREACSALMEAAFLGCEGEVDAARGVALLEKAIAGSVDRCRADFGSADCGLIASTCASVAPLIAAPADSDAPPAEGPIAVPRAAASSVLPPWKGYRFDPSQVLDGDLTTSWQPFSKRHGGVGQWLELDLPHGPKVTGLAIANGLQRVDALGDLFLMNNRVRRLTATFSDGSTEAITLAPDARGFVEVRFRPHRTTFVRLTVDGIHRGSKWNDLAISEVQVFGIGAAGGRPALPAACDVPEAAARAACEAGRLEGCQALIGFAPDDALRNEARGKALALAGPRCLAADKGAPDLGLCTTAAELALDLSLPDGDAARAEARKLARHACARGNGRACGMLGCYASWDVVHLGDTLDEADRPVCKAACDQGELGSCLQLALGGAGLYEADLEAPPMRRIVARFGDCASAEACLAAGAAAEPKAERGPLDEVGAMKALSLFEKGCTLGSGEACVRAASVAGSVLASPGTQERLNGRACELGQAMSCAEVVSDDASRARAVAALSKLCEAGDAPACRAAAGLLSASPDKAKALEDRAAALDLAACDKGEAARCQAEERRFVVAASSCLQKEEQCEVMCEVAGRDGLDLSPVDDPAIGTKTFSMLAKEIPGLTAEVLFDICAEVVIYDPCSCGCC